MSKNTSFEIENLGTCRIESPLRFCEHEGQTSFRFTSDKDRVVCDIGKGRCIDYPDSFEAAGPRQKVYFDPSKIRVGIVTCGGLCPGINNVIRTIVMQMAYNYGVRHIYGFQYGYEGFIAKHGHEILELTPEYVKGIHNEGGSILSSSRGPQDVEEIVDCLERKNLNILFCIGGDGTLRGAHAIAEEVKRRNLKISIIGVPKTIDNDILYCVKTFGFETAFEVATHSIRSAHVEAQGYYNCVVVVKLMGRDSGFIAANTVLACPDVNFVLIPEVDFDWESPNGILPCLEKFLVQKREQQLHPHAVVVVAEGAGQEFFKQENAGKDRSGNQKHGDIGLLLKHQIESYFKDRFPVSTKYIEPSYLIRSVPANAHDSIFCYYLADHAVHAAMAGKTNMMLGYWNGHFTHVPLEKVVQGRKKIDPNGELWRQVLFATGQPRNLK